MAIILLDQAPFSFSPQGGEEGLSVPSNRPVWYLQAEDCGVHFYKFLTVAVEHTCPIPISQQLLLSSSWDNSLDNIYFVNFC